VSRESRFLIFY